MAGTGITVLMVAVMIQIIYASKLTNVDSHPWRNANENPGKRTSDPYARLRDRNRCSNHNIQCLQWTSQGECFNNPMYMHRTCQHACGTCDCEDSNTQCQSWANVRECEINPDYMNYNCRLSCGQCYNTSVRRDVTRNLGNSPPGTRDDSQRQAREGGHGSPPGTRDSESV